ncbi:hypothetical protein ABEW19_27900 [Paenibacillus illinoisensis]|uniref:hypothetical protein n=1 Tax=Paenibacillus illinoisensis TaxID=59845 RepID=UPI003D2A9CA5
MGSVSYQCPGLFFASYISSITTAMTPSAHRPTFAHASGRHAAGTSLPMMPQRSPSPHRQQLRPILKRGRASAAEIGLI